MLQFFFTVKKKKIMKIKCTLNPGAYIYRFLVDRKTHLQRWDASVKVWLLWEGASHPSDDDVGGVVSGTDTLLQRLLLDQRREESWVDNKVEVKH